SEMRLHVKGKAWHEQTVIISPGPLVGRCQLSATSRKPSRFTHVVEACRRSSGKRRLHLRTQMGWIPHLDFSGRRRSIHSKPRRKTAEPLFSGINRSDT